MSDTTRTSPSEPQAAEAENAVDLVQQSVDEYIEQRLRLLKETDSLHAAPSRNDIAVNADGVAVRVVAQRVDVLRPREYIHNALAKSKHPVPLDNAPVLQQRSQCTDDGALTQVHMPALVSRWKNKRGKLVDGRTRSGFNQEVVKVDLKKHREFNDFLSSVAPALQDEGKK